MNRAGAAKRKACDNSTDSSHDKSSSFECAVSSERKAELQRKARKARKFQPNKDAGRMSIKTHFAVLNRDATTAMAELPGSDAHESLSGRCYEKVGLYRKAAYGHTGTKGRGVRSPTRERPAEIGLAELYAETGVCRRKSERDALVRPRRNNSATDLKRAA
ncbi:hypothetical protein BaRGS_00023992 [Batillaria attramentaria]|uniref:Uncharacterized protein n=1 Tax=Batillaria attramentaria TaxID=370345 RepID=A0ABD0KCL6_9CAEN